MAFDNHDVKSMNSPLIILSLSCDSTAGSNTGDFWVAFSTGSVVLVFGLLVVLVCGLLMMVVAGGALVGDCQRPWIALMLTYYLAWKSEGGGC